MKTDDLLGATCSDFGVDSPHETGSPCLRDVAREANLLRAWDRVRRNNGAAGADGVSIADLERQFPGLARHLAGALVKGSYHPRPVRRVEVPKVSGGTRKLGVPTVIDRVVQQAVVQVLQPVFEPQFSPHSFAYRPGRGPLDAVRHVQQRLSARSGWILHFDVENFFDSVAHDQVLAAMTANVHDPALVALIRETLRSGVCDDGCLVPTVRGVAQGSPLSPLLANAVLDALDQWLELRGAVFARYADDCAVLVDTRAEGERLQTALQEFLSTLALRLNQRKTTLTTAEQAEFLGFSFREGRGGRCRRVITAEALADFQGAVQARLEACGAEEFALRIEAVASLFNSWLGYYSGTEDGSQLKEVLSQTEDALRLSEWRQWSSPLVRQRFLVARGVSLELHEGT